MKRQTSMVFDFQWYFWAMKAFGTNYLLRKWVEEVLFFQDGVDAFSWFKGTWFKGQGVSISILKELFELLDELVPIQLNIIKFDYIDRHYDFIN